jgi:hypothetical protein
MPISNLAVCRPVAAGDRFLRASLVILALVSLACAAGGVFCLWNHSQLADEEHVLAPAGLILLACGLAQMRIVQRHRRAPHAARGAALWIVLASWRWLLAAAFAAYLAALAVGPVHSLGWAWLAAVAVCHTLVLLPLAATPKTVDIWRRWTQGRAQRRLSWLVAATILLMVSAEAGLQIWQYSIQQGWFSRATDAALIASAAPSGPALHTISLSPTDPIGSGSFRVAVLGDRQVMREVQTHGYLARMELMLPGLKVVPLDVPAPWSGGQAALVGSHLHANQPDLVLVMMSVCEDLTAAAAAANWFDWRQLELPRWFSAAPGTSSRVISLREGSDDFESFLRRVSPQMAACRTPMDPAMRERWQAMWGHLEKMQRLCRARQVPLALVLVPGEFQVNHRLSSTLARRMGYAADQFDLELPQRRMAGFAEHCQLPVLDLLPHLKLCRQSPYEPNGQRWNEHGKAAAAAAISGWLESRYGTQLASAAQLSSTP